MRFFIRTILLAGAVLFCTGRIHAQPTVNNFTLSVWPEYDHPGVLVVFNGRFDQSEIPVDVAFPVPERARYALVAGSTDTTRNQMIPVPIQDSETGQEIRFTAVHPVFHVEFYYNPFQTNNPHRHYTYDFVSPVGIDSLIVLLQQPLTAQSFSAEIPIDTQLQDNHGIIYHQRQYAGVEAGDTVHVEAHYENPQGSLTTDVLQAQMGGGQQNASVPPNQPGESGGPSLWLLLVVVGFVGGVLYFVMQSRTREATDEVAEKAESAADEPYEQTEAGTDTTKYCIHCGKSIPEEARFCTKCGKSQSA